MKYTLILLLASATLCISDAGRAEEKKSGITREQALGIADLVTRPVREVVVPAVDNSMTVACASSWALWDLAKGMAEQQKAGKKPVADPRFVETYIRLVMRNNFGDLCLSAGSRCKAYPGDADFAKMAQAALKDINKYAAGLKPDQSPLKRQHRDRIQGFMNTARSRGLFSLPMKRETTVRPTPPNPEEAGYIRMAAEKKKGASYTFPPWP